MYDEGGSRAVKTVPVAPGDRTRCALTDDEVLTLSRWGCAIEDHYSRRRGVPTPMDVAWAKDGRTGELFIVQARPETVHAQASGRQLEHYRLRQHGRVLVTGRSVGSRGASRYYDERYRAGFALECRALKRVRDEMGLTNVKIMVPFCRTLEEARLVGAELARHGRARHTTGSSST